MRTPTRSILFRLFVFLNFSDISTPTRPIQRRFHQWNNHRSIRSSRSRGDSLDRKPRQPIREKHNYG